MLKIDHRLSTAFHPETDGQSENTNKEMERYIRAFTDYAQDDWVDWLPLAELTRNNHVSESTGVSPLFARQGRNARINMNLDLPQKLLPHKQKVDAAKADRFAKQMSAFHEKLKEQLRFAQATQAEHANAHRAVPPRYNVGDRVYVSTKNWKTRRPSKKFDIKWYGPVSITEDIKGKAYRVALPARIPVNNSFHPDMLRPATDVDEGEQPPAIEVIGEDNRVEDQYEIEKILDSGWVGRGRGKTLKYLVKWKGYLDSEATWEPAKQVIKDGHAIVADFHHDNPKASIQANFAPPKDWAPHEKVDEADAVIGSATATGSASSSTTHLSGDHEGGRVPAWSKFRDESPDGGVSIIDTASTGQVASPEQEEEGVAVPPEMPVLSLAPADKELTDDQLFAQAALAAQGHGHRLLRTTDDLKGGVVSRVELEHSRTNPHVPRYGPGRGLAPPI